jgi:hypothetical protein
VSIGSFAHLLLHGFTNFQFSVFPDSATPSADGFSTWTLVGHRHGLLEGRFGGAVNPPFLANMQ